MGHAESAGKWRSRLRKQEAPEPHQAQADGRKGKGTRAGDRPDRGRDRAPGDSITKLRQRGRKPATVTGNGTAQGQSCGNDSGVGRVVPGDAGVLSTGCKKS